MCYFCLNELHLQKIVGGVIVSVFGAVYLFFIIIKNVAIIVLEHTKNMKSACESQFLFSVYFFEYLRFWDFFFSMFSLTGMGRKGKAADSSPNTEEGSSSDCLPCQQGCAYCKDDTPCVVHEDGALRMAVVSFQCLCMLIVFISMVLIYHFRRNKVGFIIK